MSGCNYNVGAVRSFEMVIFDPVAGPFLEKPGGGGCASFECGGGGWTRTNDLRIMRPSL